jgi:GNAT superfamily N-acetyltransferase
MKADTTIERAGFNLRIATRSDLPPLEVLLATNRELYPAFPAWLSRTWIECDSGQAQCIVATDSRDRVVGVTIDKPKADGRQKLATLYVAPSDRGHGLGRALLGAVVGSWHDINIARGYVTCRKGRGAALTHLLANQGFEHIGSALDRYGRGQHEDVYEWRSAADVALVDPAELRVGSLRRQQTV